MDTDVLVIGGGAAGLAAATRLRAQAPALAVTLLDRGAHNVYRPWFQYALPRLIPSEDLRISLPQMATRHGFTFRKAEVEKLDTAEHTALAGDETIRYRRVIVAAGAPTDPDAIPGAAQHAVFPCDQTGFTAFQRRLEATDDGAATIVLTGERISPGLEDGAWLARARRALNRPQPRVRVVADGDCLLEQFGRRATDRFRRKFESWGAELLLGARVAAITADAVILSDGRRLASTVTAVVGALRGPDVGTAALADERGFFPVDAHLRSRYDPSVFVAGDAIAQDEVRKNWQLSVRQARTAADNAVRDLRGQRVVAFDNSRDRRRSGFSLPDVGGESYLVWRGQLVTSGRRTRRIRIGFDRAHFASYLPADTRWSRIPD